MCHCSCNISIGLAIIFNIYISHLNSWPIEWWRTKFWHCFSLGAHMTFVYMYWWKPQLPLCFLVSELGSSRFLDTFLFCLIHNIWVNSCHNPLPLPCLMDRFLGLLISKQQQYNCKIEFELKWFLCLDVFTLKESLI